MEIHGDGLGLGAGMDVGLRMGLGLELLGGWRVGFEVRVVRSGLGMQRWWFICGERIQVGDGMG